MYCTRKVDDDIFWVGADNRRLKLFEAVYEVPSGISYNSYLVIDEKTALIDTADRAVTDIFIENVEQTLGERSLDYIVSSIWSPITPRRLLTCFYVILSVRSCATR